MVVFIELERLEIVIMVEQNEQTDVDGEIAEADDVRLR
jgi:hypothetical protein